MATQPEVIRMQMEDTRAALTRKLDSLEQQVHDQVENAKSAVKGIFDLPQHVDHHPWAMVGGAVALGFCLGSLLERHAPVQMQTWSGAPLESGTGAGTNGNGATPNLPDTSAKPHWLGRIAQEFDSEIERLKRLAIGAGMGMLRDSVANSVSPEVGAELSGVMDSITVKLGGEPIHGQVLRQEPNLR